MSEREPLSAKDKKQLAKQRKAAAKQAQKYHKEQEKRARESSLNSKKHSSSKIEQAVNLRSQYKDENLSREEKFRRESEEKIRNLEPKDFNDGYYIDEYGERQKQERRAKEIHDQEKEVIHRRKKPLTGKQIKHRRIFLYSGIFIAVLAIGIILSLTVLFKTEKIVVEGDEYYYDDQIIAFSGVELQQNIFIAAMGSTPKNITENLSYIEKAEVNFTIPDTITINVTDAVPSYVIKNGKGYLLISSKGRILDDINVNTDKLPELTCGKLQSTKIGDYVSFEDENIPDILEDVSESLRANEVKDITGFDVTDTANITLSYDNRIKINIGLPEDIDYKIRTAMAIINEKLDPNNTGSISGTLDVSSCNTTKMSHYKPGETVPTASAQPTTVPDDSGDTYDDGTYDDTYSGDTYDDGIYDDTYSGDTYDDGTYDDTYSGDTYDDGTYDDTYSEDIYDDGNMYQE